MAEYSILRDHKLRNTTRWQEPAYDKASDLRVIHVDGQIYTFLKSHFVTKYNS